MDASVLNLAASKVNAVLKKKGELDHPDRAMLVIARWDMWADGYLSCPVCGALVHPSYKDTHVDWHSRSKSSEDVAP